jgi:hypothetical protein
MNASLGLRAPRIGSAGAAQDACQEDCQKRLRWREFRADVAARRPKSKPTPNLNQACAKLFRHPPDVLMTDAGAGRVARSHRRKPFYNYGDRSIQFPTSR